MSTIYLVEPGGVATSYSEDHARALWNQGGISRQANYWKEGMPHWRPAAEFFLSSTPSPPPPAAPILQTGRVTAGFAKDPTTLTRFLKVMLWISLGMAILGVLLESISLATGNAAKTDSENLSAMDLVEAAVALLTIMIFIGTGVPFLMWIHRANRNARALGAQGLTFTPGWAVGWYFVPIFNLWKPYQAMKEIWQASQNPHAWATQEVGPVVSSWWTLWLLSNFLGRLAFRMTMRAQNSQAFVSAAIISLLSDLLDVALCLVAMRLVTTIYRKQLEWASRPATV